MAGSGKQKDGGQTDGELRSCTETCGLIMPISPIGDYDSKHWKDVRVIVERSIKATGLNPKPVWESYETDIIQGRIVKNIYENEMAVCDISGLNPNVMFELGMRISFRKPVIVIADDLTKIPFDTNVIEHQIYPKSLYFGKIEIFIEDLSAKILSVFKASKEGTYKAYLDSLGAFSVFEPKPERIEFDQYMKDQMEMISASISRLDNQYHRMRMEQRMAQRRLDLGESDSRLTNWPRSKQVALAEMWKEGKTASQISEQLGLSRSFVIDMAHRLGLQSIDRSDNSNLSGE